MGEAVSYVKFLADFDPAVASVGNADCSGQLGWHGIDPACDLDLCRVAGLVVADPCQPTRPSIGSQAGRSALAPNLAELRCTGSLPGWSRSSPMGLLSLVTICTGIVLNPSSLVLTNHHVASGKRAIKGRRSRDAVQPGG